MVAFSSRQMAGSKSGVLVSESASKSYKDLKKQFLPKLLVRAQMKEESICKFENRFSVSKIFTISFNYLEHVCHTKVMEVKYGSNRAIYKAALGSKFSKSAIVCWLQHQPQGWTLQLGQDIDQRLVTAITLAIDRRKLEHLHKSGTKSLLIYK